MKPRKLESLLRQVAAEYPVVTVTGPRQSGKTTLCRGVFTDKPYVSLEPLDQREYAMNDPRGFLAEYQQGAIIDEVQYAPDLLSYIQETVDLDPASGRFIITGSQHFGLTQTVNQSLAGRSAVLYLLPLSLDELNAFEPDHGDLFDALVKGGYPRIFDRGLDAQRWLAGYLTTYIERDVRNLSNIGDLSAFTQFVRLCAANTAAELNLSRLGSDAGVSHNTVKAWLSVLEASFIVFRTPAWHRNLRKQLVKAPKLHFLDSGLACHLIGIREPEQLRHHPLRGAIFESWVASEIYKYRLHRGLAADLFHFRESRGLEIDLLVENTNHLLAVEVKSAATISSSFLKSLESFQTLIKGVTNGPTVSGRIIYGGDSDQNRTAAKILSWRHLHEVDWNADH